MPNKGSGNTDAAGNRLNKAWTRQNKRLRYMYPLHRQRHGGKIQNNMNTDRAMRGTRTERQNKSNALKNTNQSSAISQHAPVTREVATLFDGGGARELEVRRGCNVKLM